MRRHSHRDQAAVDAALFALVALSVVVAVVLLADSRSWTTLGWSAVLVLGSAAIAGAGMRPSRRR